MRLVEGKIDGWEERKEDRKYKEEKEEEKKIYRKGRR